MTVKRTGELIEITESLCILNVATANINYSQAVNLVPGIWIVSSSASINIAFYDEYTNLLALGGTGSYTFSAGAQRIAYTATSSNAQITLQCVQVFNGSQITGTITTVTTTSNFTNNNRAQVMTLGGGGAGGCGGSTGNGNPPITPASYPSWNSGGGGGGSGYISNATFIGSGTYAIVIGAGGTPVNALGASGAPGGTTSFGNIVSSLGGNGGTSAVRTPSSVTPTSIIRVPGSGGNGGSGGGPASANPPAHPQGGYVGFSAGVNGSQSDPADPTIGSRQIALIDWGSGSGRSWPTPFNSIPIAINPAGAATGSAGGRYAGGAGGPGNVASIGGSALPGTGGGGGGSGITGAGPTAASGAGGPGAVYILEWTT